VEGVGWLKAQKLKRSKEVRRVRSFKRVIQIAQLRLSSAGADEDPRAAGDQVSERMRLEVGVALAPFESRTDSDRS